MFKQVLPLRDGLAGDHDSPVCQLPSHMFDTTRTWTTTTLRLMRTTCHCGPEASAQSCGAGSPWPCRCVFFFTHPFPLPWGPGMLVAQRP